MSAKEVTLDDVTAILNRWYYSEVESIADEAIKEHPEDEEARGEWIHETCDGHNYVIYTYKAQLVLAVSENSDAYGDEFGTEGIVCDDGSVNYSALAYMALRRDVEEAVSRLVDRR